MNEQKDSSTGGQFVTIKTAEVTETKNSLRKGGGNVWFWRNLSIWLKITKQLGWKWRNRSTNRMNSKKKELFYFHISVSQRGALCVQTKASTHLEALSNGSFRTCRRRLTSLCVSVFKTTTREVWCRDALRHTLVCYCASYCQGEKTKPSHIQTTTKMRCSD